MNFMGGKVRLKEKKKSREKLLTIIFGRKSEKVYEK